MFIWACYSSDSQIVTVLNLNQRVQIQQIILRKQIIRKEVPNMDCVARYIVATEILYFGYIRKT